MPELPEVEHARTLLEAALVGRTLDRVHVTKDVFVFDQVTPHRVKKAMQGRRVSAVRRHGKVHWLELEGEGPDVVVRLGMTGQWRSKDDDPLVLDASPAEIDRTWPPRFTKLRLEVDGAELAFTNPRRLGRVLLRDDVRNQKPVCDLGFDAHDGLPSVKAFLALLAKRKRANVKGLLLDQKFAAGVGNWIADEVLYQAGIDPHRSVGDLYEEEAKSLRSKLRHVVRKAVSVGARKTKFPKSWLFHVRWGKNEEARTHDGHALRFETIAGRTTAWVPTKQR